MQNAWIRAVPSCRSASAAQPSRNPLNNNKNSDNFNLMQNAWLCAVSSCRSASPKARDWRNPGGAVPAGVSQTERNTGGSFHQVSFLPSAQHQTLQPGARWCSGVVCPSHGEFRDMWHPHPTPHPPTPPSSLTVRSSICVATELCVSLMEKTFTAVAAVVLLNVLGCRLTYYFIRHKLSSAAFWGWG